MDSSGPETFVPSCVSCCHKDNKRHASATAIYHAASFERLANRQSRLSAETHQCRPLSGILSLWLSVLAVAIRLQLCCCLHYILTNILLNKVVLNKVVKMCHCTKFVSGKQGDDKFLSSHVIRFHLPLSFISTFSTHPFSLSAR